MLNETKAETFTGTSMINGEVAERYTATIDDQNPEKLTLGRMIVNAQLRKDNRVECRADQAQFEDDAYTVQDEMIAVDSIKEEVEEEEDKTK